MHPLFVMMVLAPSLFQSQYTEVEKVLTLGKKGGAGPTAFGEVREIELDEKGRLYVLDRMNNEIRVFDSGGKYINTIGRRGQGPGEFRSPLSLDYVDRQLFVTERGRVSRFGTNGGFLGMHRTNVPGISRALPLKDGGVLVLRKGMARTSGYDARMLIGVYEGGRFSLVFSGPSPALFIHTPEGSRVFKTPFCPTLHLSPITGGGYVVGDGTDGTLNRFSSDGTLVTRVKVAQPPKPLSEEEKKFLIDKAEDWAGGRHVNELAIPPFKSAICGLEAVDEETAWVRLEYEGEEGQVWRLFDLEKREVKTTMRLPRGESATAFRGDWIVTHSKGELGADYVHLLKIVR